MFQILKKMTVGIVLFVLIPTLAFPHSGRTDANGGHYNRKTGEYHYHNRGKSTSPPRTSNDSYQDSSSQEPQTQTVYITRTGHKYHREGCRYLNKSKIPISLKEAKAGYTPCKVCMPPI